MNQVGVTPDGIIVVDGIFKMFDTLGLPLADLFELCLSRNMWPSMPHFYDDAIKAGWKHKTIILRLRESLGDVKGTEYAEEVIKRLEAMYGEDTAV